MLDPKELRTDLESVARNLARRGFVLDRPRYQALEDEAQVAPGPCGETASRA